MLAGVSTFPALNRSGAACPLHTVGAGQWGVMRSAKGEGGPGGPGGRDAGGAGAGASAGVMVDALS